MTVSEQTAAMVALMRSGGRAWARYVVRARDAGGAAAVDPRIVLEEELGLLTYEALATATSELEEWQREGISVLTLRDEEYPANLAVTAARPPLLFVRGALIPADSRSVSVIGTREPSEEGGATAREVARTLAAAGVTVVSGLACGVDGEAHRAVLDAGARTLAVIGTGLRHTYPAQHRELQQQIAARAAVVSRFWPDTQPSKETFPARNAVMAGMTLASVIVEASPMSGTRIQARHALEQGRAVVLMRATLRNDWALEMADRPGVHVAETAADVLAALRI